MRKGDILDNCKLCAPRFAGRVAQPGPASRRHLAHCEADNIDEWREHQYRPNAGYPLEAVRRDFEDAHHVLPEMASGCDERPLSDRRHYPWMKGEPLVYLIEENAWLHERGHAGEIRAWRDSALPR